MEVRSARAKRSPAQPVTGDRPCTTRSAQVSVDRGVPGTQSLLTPSRRAVQIDDLAPRRVADGLSSVALQGKARLAVAKCERLSASPRPARRNHRLAVRYCGNGAHAERLRAGRGRECAGGADHVGRSGGDGRPYWTLRRVNG